MEEIKIPMKRGNMNDIGDEEVRKDNNQLWMYMHCMCFLLYVHHVCKWYMYVCR